MIRHCNGFDRGLLDGPTRTAGPCACGETFDDTDRSVVYPHVFIATRADREALAALADSIAVDPARRGPV